MKTGTHGQYRWLELPALPLSQIVTSFPELLEGKFLAIVEADSGPLRLTQAEQRIGWQAFDDVVYSPRPRQATTDIPILDYDEWYIFPAETRLTGPVETFVSRGGFSLQDPSSWLADLPPSGDLMGIRKYVDERQHQQHRFWHQLQRIAPESYISSGDLFLLVTRNEDLFATVRRAFRRVVRQGSVGSHSNRP